MLAFCIPGVCSALDLPRFAMLPPNISSSIRRGANGIQHHCTVSVVHQQNVNWSGCHTQTSQTLQSTSPVLLNNSWCSQAPLELSKLLSDSARAFSGAAEGTCSYGGAFRMLRYLTHRIVKFWSSWELCAGLRETWCHIFTAAVLRVP